MPAEQLDARGEGGEATVRGCVMGILMEQKSPKALQEEIENLTLLFN